MRKLIIAASLLLSSLYINAQTKTGRWYRTSNDTYTSYTYTTRYYKTDVGFATEYKISSPRITVTAIHDTIENQIKIDVQERGGGILAQHSQEHLECEPHSSNLFGFEGNWRMLGGDRVPYQFAVKYLSKKFDYITVKSVIGPYITNGAHFFCF
jgi:hypothetical protein